MKFFTNLSRTAIVLGLISLLFDMRSFSADALFEKYQLKSDAEGVTKLLRWLQGDGSGDAEIKGLIAQLKHPKFQLREADTMELNQLGYLPADLLEQAIKSPDFETTLRAQRVKEQRKDFEVTRTKLIAAALRLIDSEKLQVSTGLLLQTRKHLESAEQQDDWIRAIVASATSDDIKWMRDAFGGEDPLLRLAAIQALPRIDPILTADLLRPLIGARDLRVAFPAALGLTGLGDRSHWRALLTWTSSEDEARRIRGIQLLRTATGKKFGLNAFKPPASQKDRHAAWSDWLDRQDDLATGAPPLRFRTIELLSLPEDIQRGLLAHYDLDEIAEDKLVDLSGNGRDGSLARGTKLVDGVLGQAIHFQGLGPTRRTGGHAKIPFIDFNQLPAFTIALWVRHQGLTYEHGEAYICYGFDQGATFDGSLCIGSFFDNIHFRTGTGMVTIPHSTKDRLRWVHYAMTYENGRLAVFKDGLLAGESELEVDVKGDQAALAKHWWSNGRQSSTRFVGALDDIRVYGRAFDAAQIEHLFADRVRK